MDFKDSIKQISERIEKLKDSMPTEEATKNALIMPFLQALGYDVFNPQEVLPEMTCDIGMKKGEKIDYAILKDGDPVMLIECKHWAQDLNLHDNQLLRYFNVSKAKFGILTNGIHYRFYTDLSKPNVMDEKPFLEINMLDLKDHQIDELKKFHKSYFDIKTILSSASELKYATELKTIFVKEFASPSPEFVRFFTKQVYEKQITQNVIEQFTPIIKRSINSVINDIISDRLNVAMKAETPEQPQIEESIPDDPDDGVITTQEELDAYNIVRSILREHVDAKRICYKDAKSRFVINLDNKYFDWICRIVITATKKQIVFPVDSYKSTESVEIESIDDIFKHSDRLVSSLKMAMKE